MMLTLHISFHTPHDAHDVFKEVSMFFSRGYITEYDYTKFKVLNFIWFIIYHDLHLCLLPKVLETYSIQ